MRRRTTKTAALAVTTMAVMLAGTVARAQKMTPADTAAKMSGTWTLNRELSKGFSAPGRGRGGPGPAPRALFATASVVPQRGGGGGGVSDATDLTPEQRAEQAAMRQLQQLTEQITIKASVESVSFSDPRGERTYAINDKTTKIDVGGSAVSVKSKWDKSVIRQEFSNTQAKLTRTWGLDDAGHLVLTMKMESMTLQTPEQKAVFDRQ